MITGSFDALPKTIGVDKARPGAAAAVSFKSRCRGRYPGRRSLEGISDCRGKARLQGGGPISGRGRE